jgi:hypothetical protein
MVEMKRPRPSTANRKQADAIVSTVTLPRKGTQNQPTPRLARVPLLFQNLPFSRQVLFVTAMLAQ